MEEELREAFREQREVAEEAFREQREATERGFERVGIKMDGVRADLAAHQTESATRSASLDLRSRSSHRRMDEHLEEHKNVSGRRWDVYLALIGAGLSGLGTLALTLYQLLKKS